MLCWLATPFCIAEDRAFSQPPLYTPRHKTSAFSKLALLAQGTVVAFYLIVAAGQFLDWAGAEVKPCLELNVASSETSGFAAVHSEVYIIDFGLAKKYRNPETLVHGPGTQYISVRCLPSEQMFRKRLWLRPYRENKNLTGTARYASLQLAEALDLSRAWALSCKAECQQVLLHFTRFPERGMRTWASSRVVATIWKPSALPEP